MYLGYSTPNTRLAVMANFKDYFNRLIEPYIVNKSYSVNVTHINDPHSFYVQSSDIKTIDLKILEECEAPAQLVDLTLQYFIVYYSQTSKKCVRGRILQQYKTDSGKYTIFAIDYGYINEFVESKDIFIPKLLMDVPPLARHCKLANCNPNGPIFTQEDSQAMQTYVGDELCLMTIKGFEDNKNLVELRNTCPDDIATMLALTHFTNLGLNFMSLKNMENNKQELPKFSVKSIKVNDIIHIRLLDTKSEYPNTFYVADVDEYKKYIRIRREFTDYCGREMTMQEKNLTIGKYVGYRPHFSPFYERALIKNILDESKVSLYLIDTGGMERPFLYQIKDVKLNEFFVLPGIAFQCTFIVGKKDKSLPEHALPGLEVWIKIVKIGNPNSVEIVRNNK